MPPRKKTAAKNMPTRFSKKTLWDDANKLPRSVEPFVKSREGIDQKFFKNNLGDSPPIFQVSCAT